MRSHRIGSGAIAAVVAMAAVVPLARAAFAADATVTIGDRLDPARITIDRGTTVRWRNTDEDRHRVRSFEGPDEFDSGNLETGESFSFRFTRAGTYRYHDDREREDERYHGTVIVRDTSTPDGGGDGGSRGANVRIVDRAFSPQSAAIDAGETVTWTNGDDREHTVTARGGAFDSGTMPAGGRYARTFRSAATVEYFCALHPEMTGTVVVRGADGTAPPPAPPQPEPRSATGPSGVTIRDFSFSPSPMRVAVGTTVTWRNAGTANHTVSATDGSFDSGTVRSGATYRRRFSSRGTWDYLCVLHPQMRGRIVVGEGGPVRRPPRAAAPPAADGTSSEPVAIEDFSFDPAEVRIDPGTTVIWTNRGVAPHTVTADDGTFDSGRLASGTRYRRRFTAAGTYAYLCAIHPQMTGRIVVASTASPSASSSPAATTDASPPARARADDARDEVMSGVAMTSLVVGVPFALLGVVAGAVALSSRRAARR